MTRTERTQALMMMALLVTSCALQSPMTTTSSTHHSLVAPAPVNANPDGAPVIRRPLASTQPPAVAAPAAAASNALYVCTFENRQTAIEFAPNVAALCSRHPEMSPCQYEREQCRSRGGRVFAASGQEITRAIEDAYDRKVMRVRFRAN
jgi:hypothetical protein